MILCSQLSMAIKEGILSNMEKYQDSTIKSDSKWVNFILL